jgi:predicted alpha/beta superfamily hydrolase
VAFALLALSAGGAVAATVTFRVAVPPTTPPGARVFVSGNIEALGPWNPAGMELGNLGDGQFAATLTLPDGYDFEYKFTRGSWETVEKGPDFEEIPNRRIDGARDGTVSVAIANWRDQGESSGAPTVVGDLRVHADFASRVLVNSRTLYVFLPPGYDADPERRYPVLYMHDGQNLFDARTAFIGVEWQVDETVTRMVMAGEIAPLIVVGVCNTGQRAFEYTPVPDGSVGGGAARYVEFLVTEVKPFIDATYRTLPDPEHTGVMGSSLGGIASLFAAWSRPNVFRLVGAMSTSYHWGDGYVLSLVSSSDPPPGVRVWIDMGTAEDHGDADRNGVPDLIDEHRRIRDALMAHGLWPGATLEYVEDDNARHDERAWAARLPGALRFLFPPEAPR